MSVNKKYDKRLEDRKKELESRKKTKAVPVKSAGVKDVNTISKLKRQPLTNYENVVNTVNSSPPVKTTISKQTAEAELVRRKYEHKKDRAARKKVF